MAEPSVYFPKEQSFSFFKLSKVALACISSIKMVYTCSIDFFLGPFVLRIHFNACFFMAHSRKCSVSSPFYSLLLSVRQNFLVCVPFHCIQLVLW